tara:strand:- start:1901 stop:3334 length:1434 start_codon:yes stop_codon:yes gene_type:complete
MKFTQFEKIMNDQGIEQLADIARALKTTPQAVSNWKARDHIPYHVVAKIGNVQIKNNITAGDDLKINADENHLPESLKISDILLTLAEQLKIIYLTCFICLFSTFTYVQFIQEPIYNSSATILLPENTSNSLGGLAGLANQFGVNIPSRAKADLSSPTLLPEILKSRTFAEEMISKEFFSEKFQKKIPLMDIINSGSNTDRSKIYKLSAINIFNSEILFFNKDIGSSVSTITISIFEPNLAKQLADTVLMELEVLNRSFRSKSILEKTSFIEQRISSVGSDLEKSEKRLKEFNERNRQISSPALQLELDRIERETDVQKEIYMTLKQQLELAKIEGVQETSIVQVLDRPQIPISPSNKNLKISILFSIIVGLMLGAMIGLIRSYIFYNKDIDERKKLRKVKNYFNNKSKEALRDTRLTGTISILLIIGLPFYLSHTSKTPIFFGMYSAKLMLVIIIYILILIISSSAYYYYKIKERK